jgi:hypothetical protein
MGAHVLRAPRRRTESQFANCQKTDLGVRLQVRAMSDLAYLLTPQASLLDLLSQAHPAFSML